MENVSKFPYKNLFAAVAVIVGTYFLIAGLVAAQSFLAPLFIALILSLVMYPLCRRLEKWGVSRTLGALISVVVLFLISLAVLLTVFSQVDVFIDEWPAIQKTMASQVEGAKTFLIDNTPVTQEHINKLEGKGLGSLIASINDPGGKTLGVISSTGMFLSNFLLTFIYVFFMLRYRKRFVEFLVQLLPSQHTDEVRETAYEIPQLISGYLVGQLLLMGALLIAYSLGLGISGVKNFFLISFIATLLTLIPFVGNIVGFALAVAFGYLTSGDLGVLAGIILTFTIGQFLESYVLQPYVMGDRVNLHPFFVIVMVILGGAIWGLAGMILAVPTAAILTTVLMHIKSLRVFGMAFKNEPLEKEG